MTGTITANGIDVQALVETTKAITDDDSLADLTFMVRSTWQEGTHNVGEIGSFTHGGGEEQSRAAAFVMHGDEPPVLVGANRGPNAVELLLQGRSRATSTSVGSWASPDSDPASPRSAPAAAYPVPTRLAKSSRSCVGTCTTRPPCSTH